MSWIHDDSMLIVIMDSAAFEKVEANWIIEKRRNRNRPSTGQAIHRNTARSLYDVALKLNLSTVISWLWARVPTESCFKCAC